MEMLGVRERRGALAASSKSVDTIRLPRSGLTPFVKQLLQITLLKFFGELAVSGSDSLRAWSPHPVTPFTTVVFVPNQTGPHYDCKCFLSTSAVIATHTEEAKAFWNNAAADLSLLNPPAARSLPSGPLFKSGSGLQIDQGGDQLRNDASFFRACLREHRRAER